MKRFLYQSFISYKALYAYLDTKTYILFKVITPIFQLLFFSLIAKYAYNTTNITPWVLGNALLLSVYNSLFGVATILSSERFFGTLQTIVVTPINNFYLFLSRGFIHIFDSLFTVILGIVAGSIFFKLDLSNTNFFFLFLCIIITIYSSMGLGLLISSLGLFLTDLNILLNTIVFVLMIFTGAIFPLSNLPEFLRPLSEIIPITNGLKAGRMVVSNGNFNDIYILLGKELLIGSLYALLGYICFSIAEKIARYKGNIDNI